MATAKRAAFSRGSHEKNPKVLSIGAVLSFAEPVTCGAAVVSCCEAHKTAQSQVCERLRVQASSVIAPRRNDSAHFHRPRRAIKSISWPHTQGWAVLKLTKNNSALAQNLRNRGGFSYEKLTDFLWSCDPGILGREISLGQSNSGSCGHRDRAARTSHRKHSLSE